MSLFLLVSATLCLGALSPVVPAEPPTPHLWLAVHRSHQRPLIPHHRRMPAEGDMGHRRRSQKGSPEEVPTRNTRHVSFAIGARAHGFSGTAQPLIVVGGAVGRVGPGRSPAIAGRWLSEGKAAEPTWTRS